MTADRTGHIGAAIPARRPMTDIMMPRLSNSMDQGTMLGWLRPTAKASRQGGRGGHVQHDGDLTVINLPQAAVWGWGDAGNPAPGSTARSFMDV